jgi:hypothetical protein
VKYGILYTIHAAPSTSAHGSQKTFQVSNQAVDEVSELSDAELSDSHIRILTGSQKSIDTKLMMLRL